MTDLNVNGSDYGIAEILSDVSVLKVDSTILTRLLIDVANSLFSRTDVSPTLAAGIDVTPAATAWKLGAAAAIVATGGITSDFQITGVNIEGVGTTSGVCEIFIYEGTAASSAVANIRAQCSTSMGVAAGGVNGLHIPVITKRIVANKSVYAKAACDTTHQTVPKISINYKVA